jgi:hypothetical protein
METDQPAEGAEGEVKVESKDSVPAELVLVPFFEFPNKESGSRITDVNLRNSSF